MPDRAPKAAADIAKNRLYITVAGKLSKENLDRLYTDIRFCVADLSPGFSVITDLTGCTIAALSGIPTFRKITNYLVTSKVGRIVRVVDENKIVLKQLINFTAQMNGYKADHFHSLSEAETVLANAERRDGLRFVLHQRPVSYGSESLEGNGTVYDISTSGCAIRTADKIPPVHATVFVSIVFDAHERLIETFASKSEVIWVEGDILGVRFASMNTEQRELLWERLVYESRSELF